MRRRSRKAKRAEVEEKRGRRRRPVLSGTSQCRCAVAAGGGWSRNEKQAWSEAHKMQRRGRLRRRSWWFRVDKGRFFEFVGGETTQAKAHGKAVGQGLMAQASSNAVQYRCEWSSSQTEAKQGRKGRAASAIFCQPLEGQKNAPRVEGGEFQPGHGTTLVGHRRAPAVCKWY